MRSKQLPRWRPPGPPTSVAIYPDPRRDCWRHTQSGPDMGILNGYLNLPASALPAEVRQSAEIMLAEAGRTYYDLDLIIDWHPADAHGRIPGDVRAARAPYGP